LQNAIVKRGGQPLVLGAGKRLFGEGTISAAFGLTQVEGTPGGVIVAHYERQLTDSRHQ
jgi:hypothetical protein